MFRARKRTYRGRIGRAGTPYTLSPLLLHLDSKPPRRKRRFPHPFLPLLAAAILLWAWVHHHGAREEGAGPLPSQDREQSDHVSWRPRPEILAVHLTRLDGAGCLEIPDGGAVDPVFWTSLDPELQHRVERRLRQSMALGGIAVFLDPASGRIMALATYNKDRKHPLAAFWKAYPAASIFKIVTAAAALEEGLLEPASILAYTGRNHTLYRRDLTAKVYPWSTRVSLREAFALSLNPVFGKIGIYTLGPTRLRRFGSRFFFGQPLPSEVPFETSRLAVPADRIGIAEVASGFNDRTLLTVLHAAWIGSVVVSDGAAPAPWLVVSARDGTGREIYRHTSSPPIRVLSPGTARKMRKLMEATVRYGTCRKSFAGRRRDRRLRGIVFGGKTGNVNNRRNTIKYDWFVGYGRESKGGKGVVLAVMMLHGRFLGHRANVVAFDLFRRYFHLRR